MSEYKRINSTVHEINEDSVQVNFYSKASNHDIAFWENLCEEINSTLKTLSHNYIWHRDEFKVYLPIFSGDNDGTPTNLTSTICFGDNIEDEWYIVYLVMEISNCYKDLIIQIVDNDGDFLLIEAANYLPIWANPESTVNRVFIFNNAIHIIPPILADLSNEIKLIDALQIITNYSEKTKASSEIQDAITARLGQYPQKIEDNIHTAIVMLPLDIAAVLTIQPSLIAPIVTTYCNHDIIDANSCRNLDYNDYIPVQVKFTKCLYAMLMHSKAMRHFQNDNSTKQNKRDILGNKLTYGFKMIMNISSDVFSTKQYKKFESNLKDIGYFKGNIENSLEYNQLLDKARKYFLNVESPMTSCVSNNISKLINSHDFTIQKEKLKIQNVDIKDMIEDNDDWLNIDPNQLNDLLNNRYGSQVKFETNDFIAPETIKTKLAHFLEQPSDYEGIDTSKTDDTEDDCINFDANQFEKCLEKIMDFISSDVNEINLHDESDSECESDISDDVSKDYELDKELAKNLSNFEESRSQSKSVVFNLTQSIKEEGFSGPSSNLLTNIGIRKADLLDSDDDD